MAKKVEETKELEVKETGAMSAIDRYKQLFASFHNSEEAKELQEKVAIDSMGYSFFEGAKRINMAKPPIAKFVLGEDKSCTPEVIVGTILRYENDFQYRQNRVSESAPLCSSKGGVNGTLFGKCSECKFGKYNPATGTPCDQRVKLLIAIWGEAQLDRRGFIEVDKSGKDVITNQEKYEDAPFELSIPLTSKKAFKEYLKTFKTEKMKLDPNKAVLPTDVLTVFSIESGKSTKGQDLNILALKTDRILADDIILNGNEELGKFAERALKMAVDPKYRVEWTPYTEPDQVALDKVSAEAAANAAAAGRITEVTEANIEEASVIADKPVPLAIADASKGNIEVNSSDDDTPF